MHTETEVKLLISAVEDATSKLKALGCVTEIPKHFEDNFLLDDAEQKLSKRQSILRVRLMKDVQSGKSSVILTFKGKAEIKEGIKTREEIECTVDHYESLLRILSALDFKPAFRYQKYRTVYKIPGASLLFCFDETPIGNFLELEGDRNEIHLYAEKLGFLKDQYISASYATLYAQHCAKRGIIPGDMIFDTQI